MHELDGDDFASVAGDDDRLIPSGMRKLAGAAMFVGVVAALGLWSYRLGTRDATEVPIIKAMEGPSRVEPQDPGGVQAAHQGLEVNTVLAGRPAVAPEKSSAAPAPATLASEDAPQGELVLAAPAALAARVIDGSGDLPVPREDSAAGSPADLVAQLSDEAQRLGDPTGTDPAALDPEVTGETDATADSSATRPRNRPSNLVVARAKPPAPVVAKPAEPAAKTTSTATTKAPTARTAATPAAAAAAASTAPAAASASKPGARLVQLGAFDSESSTRKAWDQLVARNPDLLASKSLVAERATSNARVFYRLRVAGFSTADQTRQMCEALRTRGIDCIPVTVQ